MQQGSANFSRVAGHGFGGVHLPHADNAHQILGRFNADEMALLPGVYILGHGKEKARFVVRALYLNNLGLEFKKGRAFGQGGAKEYFHRGAFKLT